MDKQIIMESIKREYISIFEAFWDSKEKIFNRHATNFNNFITSGQTKIEGYIRIMLNSDSPDNTDMPLEAIAKVVEENDLDKVAIMAYVIYNISSQKGAQKKPTKEEIAGNITPGYEDRKYAKSTVEAIASKLEVEGDDLELAAELAKSVVGNKIELKPVS